MYKSLAVNITHKSTGVYGGGVCVGMEEGIEWLPYTLDAVYTASKAQGPRAPTVDKFTIIPPFLCGGEGEGVVCVEGERCSVYVYY